MAPLTREELHALADRLLCDDLAGVEACLSFFQAETRGLWHGRARALIARRLKHCRLSPEQRTQAVDAILDRLASGRFSEQFKDQLRLALHLAPEQTLTVARKCQGSSADHVRRYATWILSHQTFDFRTESDLN
jgi:hypothetical protein